MKSAHFLLLSSIFLFFLACNSGSGGKDGNPNPDSVGLLLFSSMNSEEAILDPEVSKGTYSSLEEAVPGTDDIEFETGKFGQAAKFTGESGDRYFNGIARFHGDNFDFADPGQDGGRLDFWIKFNENPHKISSNTWLARSNYGATRYINLEFTKYFFIDVYSEVATDETKTNYGQFRANVGGLDADGFDTYENMKQGEWHVFSILWRNNGDDHKAQLHFFIDGTQEDCSLCNDFGGNLPAEGGVTDFVLSPDLYANFIQFSMDEMYSFDTWDVSGIEGNFPELTWIDDVLITYPQDNRGLYQGVWGPAVPSNSKVTFGFFAMNEDKKNFDCDLYVDGDLSKTVSTSHMAYTEVQHDSLLSAGDSTSHTVQVKCDDDKIQSKVVQFGAEPL